MYFYWINLEKLQLKKRVKNCLLIVFLSIQGLVGAQPSALDFKKADKVYAVLYTNSFIDHFLKFNKGKEFYDFPGDSLKLTSKNLVKDMYYYVYASYKDSLKSVFGDDAFKYFHHNAIGAKHCADSLKKIGYDIMLYKTAATSEAKFTERILDYEPGTIAFIMLHESVHRHRQNTKSKLPYILEEALGDLTGNLFSKSAVTIKSDKKRQDKFIALNEKIYQVINKAIYNKLSKEKCTKKLRKLLKKGNNFQRDRFDYEINNAFLLRYTSYCKYYFVLKEIYKRWNDVDAYYADMFSSVRGTEEEAVRLLKNWETAIKFKF